jgi:hypothetical protein
MMIEDPTRRASTMMGVLSMNYGTDHGMMRRR